MDTRKIRTLRQIARDRILQEMLHSARGKDASKGKDNSSWKVLILDEVTVKVISKVCKMGDIFDEGISVVEDLNKRRQPMRTLEAVYFLHPSQESVALFMEDMAPKTPLYKKAHVFFTMPLPKDLLRLIKGSPSVLSRIASLAELNLEFWIVDTQGFITDHDLALQQICTGSEISSEYRWCIQSVASRLATVFASLKELPAIRYRAASSSSAEPEGSALSSAPLELARALAKRMVPYKNIANFPPSETCDLLIVTRSVDPVAPVIHEWTYDAMMHDLLELDGSKYTYERTTAGGKTEQKQVLIEEHDPVWTELRDLHIADASSQLSDKMKEFGVRNNAAKLQLGTGSRGNLTTREMQKLVQSLPQYHDELEKLSLHVDIATLLNDRIQKDGLSEIGQLEQDFVYGGASSKDLISILTNRQDLSTKNKVRLLMIFAASYPEKMDANKLSQWTQLARLSQYDMEPVTNIQHLGVKLAKKQQGHHFSLKFGARGQGKGLRKDKELEEGAWQLSKFTPAIQDVVEELAEGKLSKTDFPYVQLDPEELAQDRAPAPTGPVPPTRAPPDRPPAQSARTKKTTWASKTSSSQEPAPLRTSEASQHSSHASSHSSSHHSTASSVRSSANGSGGKILGKRIFVFIIGGMTYSELRVAHKLTEKLKREVVVGSTSLDNCHQFLEKVRLLGRNNVNTDNVILDF